VNSSPLLQAISSDLLSFEQGDTKTEAPESNTAALLRYQVLASEISTAKKNEIKSLPGTLLGKPLISGNLSIETG
ncbi:MAG: hypothetical protein WBQ95_14505, partial [Terracidiphilus sp.]